MKDLFMSMAIRQLIRLLSLCSILLTLGWQTWQWISTRTVPGMNGLPYGLPLAAPLSLHLALLGAAIIGVLLIFVVLMPTAMQTLLRCPDLLVPLGFLAPIGTLLIPSLIQTLVQHGVVGRQQEILIVSIWALVMAVFSAWMTRLVLYAVQRRHADAFVALRDLPRDFLRLMPLILVSWCVAQLEVTLCYRVLYDVAPLAAPIAGGLGILAWNLATAALLPGSLNSNLNYPKAILASFEVSIRGLGRWLLPLLAQMALLGLVTYVLVIRPASPPYAPSWHLNVFWTGGYESVSRWYGDILAAVGAPPVALIQTVLMLVFGILAIGLKAIIVERMNPMRTYRYRESPDPFVEEMEEADQRAAGAQKPDSDS